MDRLARGAVRRLPRAQWPTGQPPHLARTGRQPGRRWLLQRRLSHHRQCLDPSARHLVGLGSQLEIRGSRDEALALYEVAIDRDPEYAEAHYRAASWHMWTDARRTEAGLRRTLELDDGHAMAWSALGFLLGQREAWKRAGSCLTRAIRLGSAGALPHVYRGHHAWHRGRLRKAEAAYREGMQADPGNPHPLFALGDLFRHEARSAEARQAYEAALLLDPECGDAALRLGYLHDEEGRPREAAALLRRGLTLAPEHPWDAEVRERLRELEELGGSGLAAT